MMRNQPMGNVAWCSTCRSYVPVEKCFRVWWDDRARDGKTKQGRCKPCVRKLRAKAQARKEAQQ